MDTRRLERAMRGARRSAGGGVALVTRGGESWSVGDVEAPMPLASVTKLVTTAVVLQMVRDGLLSLDDTLLQHLGGEVERLVVVKGVDHTPRLTLRHLITQTSGLPDAFDGDGPGYVHLLRTRGDREVPLPRILLAVRSQRPVGAPGQRAWYADVNFDLLGAVIEKVDGCSYRESVERRIAVPAGLSTLRIPEGEERIPPVWLEGKPLRLPMFFASTGPDGGGVASARDTHRFLHGFMHDEFFPTSWLGSPRDARLMQPYLGPTRYGVGHMVLRKAPWLRADVVGHTGFSGAFAFYEPVTGATVVGDVRRVDDPTLALRAALGLLNAAIDG